MDDRLQQGIAAARAGRRDEARELLIKAVEADERNAAAWLWLSGVLDNPADIRVCLENVVELEPGNERAKQGLAWLDARYGPPAKPEPPQPPAPVEAPVPDMPAPTVGAAALAPTVTVDPTIQPSLPPDPDAPAEPGEACPYCGSPVGAEQTRCPECRRDLMVRTEPREQRSIWLTILGILWIISSVLTLLAGLLFTLVLGVAAQQIAAFTRGSFPFGALLPGVGVVIFGAFALWMSVALLRRQRWAYYVVVVLTVFSLVVMVVQVTGGAAMIGAISSSMLPESVPPEVAGSIATITGLALLCSVGLNLLYVALVVLSYRDFFGPRARMRASVEPADDREHFNRGLAFKNQQMWYMAMLEWEAAVAHAPRDPSYLHALGLAYAQVGRFDQARRTLDTAIQVSPGNPQIQESRALVDRMAAKA
jgi:tetratricopeptide (TPR) repeat protein